MGEKLLRLGDREFLLRPSFKALCQIESMTGKSILTLVREFSNARPYLSDIAYMVYAMYLESKPEPGRTVPVDEIGQMILANDLFKISPIVLKCITDVLNSGNNDAKKNSATPEAPTTA